MGRTRNPVNPIWAQQSHSRVKKNRIWSSLIFNWRAVHYSSSILVYGLEKAVKKNQSAVNLAQSLQKRSKGVANSCDTVLVMRSEMERCGCIFMITYISQTSALEELTTQM